VYVNLPIDRNEHELHGSVMCVDLTAQCRNVIFLKSHLPYAQSILGQVVLRIKFDAIDLCTKYGHSGLTILQTVFDFVPQSRRCCIANCWSAQCALHSSHCSMESRDFLIKPICCLVDCLNSLYEVAQSYTCFVDGFGHRARRRADSENCDRIHNVTVDSKAALVLLLPTSSSKRWDSTGNVRVADVARHTAVMRHDHLGGVRGQGCTDARQTALTRDVGSRVR
jgi:hypothetical protein